MITIGSRVRWNGLVGHEGTVLQVSVAAMWAWVLYDDGTEKDAYISELQQIQNE